MQTTSGEEVVVWVTAGSEAEARSVARALVEAGLAACCNLIPGVRSIYRWQGRVRDEPEWLLAIKTLRGRLEALEAKVREVHSYDTPEIIATPIVAGSEPYLDWLRESCGSREA